MPRKNPRPQARRKRKLLLDRMAWQATQEQVPLLRRLYRKLFKGFR